MKVDRVRVQFSLRVDSESQDALVKAETALYQHLDLLRKGRRFDIVDWVTKACLSYLSQEQNVGPGQLLQDSASTAGGHLKDSADAKAILAPASQDQVVSTASEERAKEVKAESADVKSLAGMQDETPVPVQDTPLKRRLKGAMG